jgi:carnitine O-acetyltransferase
VVRFDPAGKVSLEHIYTAADPRAYFGYLRDLEYRIPQLAKPHFVRLIDELRGVRGGVGLTVVDVGCSYGVNGALLRCDLSMDALYAHYRDMPASASAAQVLARDVDLVATARRTVDGQRSLRQVGLDVSAEALRYAVAAGFLDDGVLADLERDDPSPEQRDRLGRADLVISTGCLGYTSERTLARVVGSASAGPPWMAHTILRMYPYQPVVQCLDELGYSVEFVDGLLRQRRFASAEEQALVLDTLSELGVDPTGWERDGWLYAYLFIARPRRG